MTRIESQVSEHQHDIEGTFAVINFGEGTKFQTTVHLANGQLNEAAVLIKVVSPPNIRTWGPLEYEELGAALMEHTDAEELKDYGTALAHLYEYLSNSHRISSRVEAQEEQITESLQDSISYLEFLDEDSSKVAFTALRYAALMPVVRSRFEYEETRIRNRTGGENRTGNLENLRWNRYPEDFKSILHELHDKERKFRQKGNL